jgi:2,4-dichlorophenol 6-monooxygenase
VTAALETDVLIVGSGPAGGSSALFLSTLGIENVCVTKYRWTADTPRAHITNQRTMEILRDVGVEQDVIEKATPQHLMGQTSFCTSLAGEELARLHTWGTHPARLADYTLASPSRHCDIPQTYMEPILVGRAAERGTRLRFDTEYVSHEQDEEGVRTLVRDRRTGSDYAIRSKYLIGADGGRSQVAQDIGLPSEGQMDIAGSMNIVFEADLSHLVEHRPSVLYWVLQPGSDVGGIGLGLVRMVRPWHEWLIVWGYDISEPAPVIDAVLAEQIARNLIGDPDVRIRIKSTSIWGNNKWYATEYARGRVFCMGDACHRHPPSNGLGSNTSIQDAYNLAWKLALVLRGKAAPSLLDTYQDERAPIGKQIVLRANKSIDEFAPIFDALGLLDTSDPDVMRAHMEARKQDTPAAAEQRRKLREAIELKNYEFNAHGVEMNHRYRSAAVVPDGTPEPEFTRDQELYYQPTTWPGARLPHVWLEHQGRRVSSHDLAGKGRFALLTGIGGDPWVAAARDVAARTGVEIAPYVIGPGRDVLDTYDDWARVREVDESGAVLIRPDGHVAGRYWALTDDPAGALSQAMQQLLNPATPTASAAAVNVEAGA